MRRLVYPNYNAEVTDGGDIRFRFTLPGSKFGPVEVILTADDAEGFLGLIDKALDKSDELLRSEPSA